MSDTLGRQDASREILEAIPDAAFIVQDGHHVDCNAAARRFFGLASVAALGRRPFHEFVHPEEQSTALLRQRRILGGETIRSFVERSRDPAGGWRHLELTGAPIAREDRAAALYVVRDVTARIRDVEEHRSLADRLIALVEQVRVGAGLVDESGTIRTANRALRDLLGLDPVGHELHELFADGRRDADDRAGDHVVQLAVGGNAGRWVRLTRSSTTPDGQVGTLVQLEDVDDQVRHGPRGNRDLDPVTGLENRDSFIARLHGTLVDGPVVVVTLDLDGFTLVNSSHGLGVGDEVLAEVGRRLSQAVRPGDVVARLGGDSFAVLAPSIGDVEQARVIAQRCHAVIGDPIERSDVVLHLRASVGVAVGTAGEDPEKVLRAADAALAVARRTGGERVELAGLDPSEQARRRLALDAAFRQALRDEAIEAHLQPIWRTGDRRCVALEALARWTTREGEAVRPDRFVRLASELGLATELDLLVARRAAAALAAVVGAGIAPTTTAVTVNVDPLLLGDPGAVTELTDGVLDAGVGLDRLIVEITERRLPDDNDALLTGLEMLQSRGVRIALDDFGVGQSSLARLITLPFDIIKLDRAFVTHLGLPRGRDVVAGIIEMTRRVQLQHVVEGVETERECRQLRALGVERAQGWLVSPALSPDQLADYDGWAPASTPPG